MSETIVPRIISSVPESFFLSFREAAEAAYGASLRESRRFAPEQWPRALGQLRHFHLNDALRLAGSANGLFADAPETQPAGDRPSVVKSGSTAIARVSINLRRPYPRPTKFRKAIAALNEHLSRRSFSLFEPTPEPVIDGLGVLLVTINPPRYADDLSVPLGVFVGVPTPDLKDWFAYIPISAVLAAYNEPVEQSDIAIAKLKSQRAKGIETHDEKGAANDGG